MSEVKRDKNAIASDISTTLVSAIELEHQLAGVQKQLADLQAELHEAVTGMKPVLNG